MDGAESPSPPQPTGWRHAVHLLHQLTLNAIPAPLRPYVERRSVWLVVVAGLAVFAFLNRDSIGNAWLRISDPQGYENKQNADKADLKAVNAKLDAILAAQGKPPLSPEDRKRQSDAAKDVLDEQGAAAKALTEGRIPEAIAILESEARGHSREAAARWRRIGDLTLGIDFAKSWAAYEQAFTLQPDHFWTCIQLSRLRIQAGKLPEALAVAQAAETLATTDRERSVAEEMLGHMAILVGDLIMARQHFQTLLQATQRLAAANPTSAQAQRDLSVSHNKLGNVERQADNLDTARTHFQTSLDIRQRLATDNPTSAQAQRDLSVSLEKLGTIEQEAGNLDAARQHFQACLDIAQRLAAANPTSAQAQRDLSVSHNKLGEVEQEAGDLDAARQHFQACLDIAQRLATDNPTSAQAQRDLSVSHNTLGEVERRADNLDAARQHFQAALDIAQRLAVANPTSAEAQRDLFVSHGKLGQFNRDAGNKPAALTQFRTAREIMDKLAKDHPDHPGFRQDLAQVEKDIAALTGER